MREPILTYREVRDQIRTGDILLYRGRGWVSRAIQSLTGGGFSHSGMITWWSPLQRPELKRLMVFEARHPYVTLRPASESVGSYGAPVCWYALNDDDRRRLDESRFLSAAGRWLGLEFSVGGLVDNLLHILGVPNLAAQKRARERFCSEYVSECFSYAGLDPHAYKSDHFTTPADLAVSGLWEYRGVLGLSRVAEYARHRAHRARPLP